MARAGRHAFDQEQLSPAEQIVEDAAPRSMIAEPVGLDVDVDIAGDAIRPWEPKGERALGADPEITVAGEDLAFSPDPPLTAGGASPALKNSFARWTKDE